MTEPQNETNVRLDNHSGRLVILEEFKTRTEKRVNDLELDRETVHNLVTTIGLLAAKVQELANGVDSIAERAVAKVLSQKASLRKASWKHNLSIVTGAFAAAGAAFGVVNSLFHLIHL